MPHFFLALLLGLTSMLQAQYYMVEYDCTHPLELKLNQLEDVDGAALLLMLKHMPEKISYIERYYLDASKGRVRCQTFGEGDKRRGGIRIDIPPTDYFYEAQTKQIFDLEKPDTCYTPIIVDYEPLPGREQEILGYNCQAAQARPGQGLKPHTIWYCPDLPSALHPFLWVRGIEGAILRLEGEDGTLISARSLDLKAAEAVKKQTRIKIPACKASKPYIGGALPREKKP